MLAVVELFFIAHRISDKVQWQSTQIGVAPCLSVKCCAVCKTGIIILLKVNGNVHVRYCTPDGAKVICSNVFSH